MSSRKINKVMMIMGFVALASLLLNVYGKVANQPEFHGVAFVMALVAVVVEVVCIILQKKSRAAG